MKGNEAASARRGRQWIAYREEARRMESGECMKTQDGIRSPRANSGGSESRIARQRCFAQSIPQR